jgi:hypothetical protein
MATLLNGGEDGGPISVNDLFRYATDTGRIDRDPIEVKSRPDDSSNVFRASENACMRFTLEQEPPALTPTEYTEEGYANQPQFFGFAWRGLPADVTNPMVFDLVKSIEWRPDMVSGLTQVTKHTYHPQSQVTRATHLLDTRHRGWATRPHHQTGLLDLLERAGRGAFQFAQSKQGRSLMRSAYKVAQPMLENFTMAAPMEELGPPTYAAAMLM